MRQAIVHLIEVHGRRRIGFINGLPGFGPHEERYQAYLDALDEYGLTFDPARVAIPHDAAEQEQSDWGQVALRRLLDEQKADIDALVTNDDRFAHNLLPELQARDIRVPDDIALVSFDDEEGSHCLTPPLTTVPIPIYEMGRQAAETLLAKLEGREVLDQAIDVPSDRLIVRQSCGCLDPKVTQVVAGSVKRIDTAEPLEASLAALRESMVAEMLGVVENSVDGLDPDWAEQLLDSFVAALTASETGAASARFLSTLDEILRQVLAVEGDIEVWVPVLSTLRRQILPYFSVDKAGALARDQAEDLWLQAQMMIGEVGQRVQAYQDLQAERRKRILNQISTALATNFDPNDLADILARELPRLGIVRGYLSLYEDPQPYQYPQPVPEWSRLVLAFDDDASTGSRRVELEAGGQRFLSRQLVPEGILPQKGQYDLIVRALYFQDQQMGFVLFDGDQRDGDVYDMLSAQISSALWGETLYEEAESRSQKIQVAAKVAQIVSSILDPEELIQETVNLIREGFDLYYVGLFLTDSKNGHLWARLRAGTGSAGQEMLQKEHKLRVDNHSMVGACIATGETRIEQNVSTVTTRFSNPLLPETRSELALPLIGRGETIGALSIQSTQEKAFDEEDIAVLQTMADQVAIALTTADLFVQIQQRAKELAEATELAEAARDEAEAASTALAKQMWQTAGQADLANVMRGEQDLFTLADNIIRQLCHYLQAQIGALYIVEDQKLNLMGSYAYNNKKPATNFKLGQGLVGQAAVEKKLLLISNVPDDYITISSGWGETIPRHIIVIPFLYEDQVTGVIELGTLTEFSSEQLEFLEAAMPPIAIAFNTAQARARIDELLVETQQQAEELQAQSEELRVANEELQTQTENLQRSEQDLRGKQVELEQANVELEEKAAALQEKQTILDQQNQVLKAAQTALEQKAEELALASKYKSEFLANMSHELRTPLNSQLILAGMLKKNEDGNLTSDQVESLDVIYNSGHDLLRLINEILDLSKIEAGRLQFNFAPMNLHELGESMKTQFAPLAEDKGLAFEVSLGADLPTAIESDPQRVQQIIKNFLSNAFKFTETGRVQMDIYHPDELPKNYQVECGLEPAQTVAFSITDTGIGITLEQQKIVFEAFQQADGSISRKYGGTGLGLSISRELSIRLGGFIALNSKPGKGSTFTLYLPVEREQGQVVDRVAEKTPVLSTAGTKPANPAPFPTQDAKPTKHKQDIPTLPVSIPDDRDNLQKGDKILLIIEDDADFAKVVFKFARRKGFKCLAAVDGETGLLMAETYQPDAIVLDLYLPRMSGWEVLAVLKDSPEMRHIPVHIMSADTETLEVYNRGAMGFLSKPAEPQNLEQAFQKIEQFIEREMKNLLIVEDEENLRLSIKKLLSGSDIKISEAATGQAALDLLAVQHFDCMILDLSLPDISGFEVLNQINTSESLTKCPVIIYTGRDLTEEENLELMKYADSVIVKGVRSPERLLDETALFLHRVVADLPEEKQQTIKRLHDQEALLNGKRILIVDDDARNAFALSKLLSDKGIKVNIARDGQQALEFLDEDPEIDLILMDVMMPVMDGYETTRRVRAKGQFRELPILALTAKAMVGDREKCLQAGANDYMTKPIDAERLLSMLRVWLYR
jgi:CheY-like chemotaxis protein/signal transduction histidine kinase